MQKSQAINKKSHVKGMHFYLTKHGTVRIMAAVYVGGESINTNKVVKTYSYFCYHWARIASLVAQWRGMDATPSEWIEPPLSECEFRAFQLMDCK